MTARSGSARFTLTRASRAAGGQPAVMAVSGDIDLANVAEFEEAMAGAVAAGTGGGSRVLTVDLTEVTYCDSAAVRALFSVAATTDLTMLVRPSGHMKTLLGISGLDRVANVIVKN